MCVGGGSRSRAVPVAVCPGWRGPDPERRRSCRRAPGGNRGCPGRAPPPPGPPPRVRGPRPPLRPRRRSRPSPCRGGSRRGRVARGAAPRGCVPRRRPAGRRGAARRCALPPRVVAAPRCVPRARGGRGRRGCREKAPRRPPRGVDVWEAGWRAVGLVGGGGRGPAVGGDRRAPTPPPPACPARARPPRSPRACACVPRPPWPSSPPSSKPGRAPACAAGSCSPPAPRLSPSGGAGDRAGVDRGLPVPGSSDGPCLSSPSPGLAPLAPLAPSETRPQIRRGDPLNLSILVSGGKETNQDSLSNGE